MASTECLFRANGIFGPESCKRPRQTLFREKSTGVGALRWLGVAALLVGPATARTCAPEDVDRNGRKNHFSRHSLDGVSVFRQHGAYTHQSISGTTPEEEDRTMSKNLTRIDNADLKVRTALSIESVRAAREIVEPTLLATLQTKESRASLLRPPKAFPDAAEKLAQAAVDHPSLAQAVAFDPEAVREDLANAHTLLGLQQELEALTQLVADARLLSLHEAYVASLGLYAVAKAVAPHNAPVATLINPLGNVFDLGRRGDTPDVVVEEVA